MGNPPTSRFGHTATAIGPHLLIFGGWEYTKAQNEIIVLREVSNQDDPNEEHPEEELHEDLVQNERNYEVEEEEDPNQHEQY